MARNMQIAPGGQATTSTGLNYLLGQDNDTVRVPYKEKGSVTLADLIKVNASGSKSGKNQIQGAPEGITSDNQTINALINLDIPINEKLNIIGSYAYGKGRNKIEKGDKELFLDEGGYKDRNIGVGFNQGNEGLSGSVMRNLETGDDDFKIKFLKKFADGGRTGFNEGSSVMSILKSKGGAGKGILGTELGYDGLMSLIDLLQNSGLFADGGRAGYNEGNKVLPKPKPKSILPENATAESGQAITRNNPVADLIEKYYLYQKSMPGVSQDTQIYLIEDFKNSLNKSGISQEDFMMRLSEDKEMR